MVSFQFHLPVQIRFGKGRIQDLQSIIGDRFKRILIVTDKGVAEKSRALEAILPQMQDYHVTLFNQVEQNPSYKTLEKGREVVHRDDIELIIGLGGGSPMDAAKGIAVLAKNEKTMQEYMAGEPLDADPLPIICIPTTSGTGSEVTPFAVFTDTEEQVKDAFSHPQIFPAVSIIDPELTYTVSKTVIANTALDVLTHAIEAYFSKDAQPFTDAMVLEAIPLVLEALAPAIKHNEDAMEKMAYASLLAGMAIAHCSTILLHAMAYPLTTMHRVPHGKANGILLPAFLKFMRKSSTIKERVAVIEQLFETVGGVEAFLDGLKISHKLTDYGVESSELDIFVKKVIVKEDLKITPANITEKIIKSIYESTM
ncbi:iron-containing alcohol dehydrogenase [bacterium]|nr:iron-containing alcohol dehydrogenase [bacterium]